MLGERNFSPLLPLATVMVMVFAPVTRVPAGIAYSTRAHISHSPGRFN
jgi:hypothetical protein